MPHWKTAGNLKGRLLITGGALTTAGTPRRTFRSKPALPLNFQSFRMAKDAEEGEMLWAARKTALWSALALKHNPDDDFLAADACVPVLRLGDIIERTHAMLEESGLVGCCMGHVGDGECHGLPGLLALQH
jgi:FAD/FMN-containing dehydrogenase